MRRPAAFRMLAVLVCLPLLACTQDVLGSLSEAFAISQAVMQEFGIPSVSVQMKNGRALGLTLVNSRFNHASSDERRAQAISIARFALSRTNKMKGIKTVRVRFEHHETKYLIVEFTETVETFHFRVSELQNSLI